MAATGKNRLQMTMAAAERQALIVERRAANVSLRVIGAELGISATRVHQIYEQACKEIPSDALHTIRCEFKDSFDRAVPGLWQIAEGKLGGSLTSRVEAYRALLQWNESLRKMNGVDAPQRREVTVITEDVIDNEIAKLSEQIALASARTKELADA
jgi:hypothetical protein